MENVEILYTVKEVSELIKCNKNYVYQLFKEGLLIPLKLGSLKVTRLELLDFLERNKGKDLSNPSEIKQICF